VDIFRKVDTMSRMRKETRSRRPRRQFDEDFKAQAVRLVLDEGKTVGGVARDLDLTETALREWVKRARADRTKGKTGLTTAEREELARLRKDVRILREEREILKNQSRAPSCPTCGPETPGVRSLARGCGRPLSGDITNPLKNMVRGWPAHVSVVTP
jgi:transposase